MLTVAATKQLVQALVLSHLDYCNSLLTGIPTSLMSRFKMVQHRAAHPIFRSSGHQSVTVLMKDLHWLAVTSRVLFKVFVLVYRMRHQLGINGVAHAWFESYLTGRTQRIRIGDAWSLAKFLLYCVPQGSVLGPLLFLIYILPLHHLILSHGLQVHGYADDTQVYLSISDPANPDTTRQECTRLESCLTDIHLWMSANKLKLNTDKTEVLVVGTERKLSSFNLTAISVAGCRVLVSDKPISNLGVSFDRNLSMCNQVHRVVRSAYFHLRSIGLARKMLTVAATKQLVQALVISRLDYCNSLLTGIPTSLMSRLEMVQHRAARLIFRSSGHQSVTVLMKDLHWLPVTSRVLFKVLVLVYKCRNGLGPGI